MGRVCYRLRANSRFGFNFSGAAPKTVAHAHSQCKRWRPHKIKTQTRLSPKTVAHAPHSKCKRWRPQQNRNRIANQREDGRTCAEFTMQAVAAPTKIETQTQMRSKTVASCRIHNASGGGPNKIETQTQISLQTVEHAPHSQCKRWRPQQNQNSNANQPEDGRTRATFIMQSGATSTQSKSTREPSRRRSQTRRIHNASAGGPNKIEIRTQISAETCAHAPH